MDAITKGVAKARRWGALAGLAGSLRRQAKMLLFLPTLLAAIYYYAMASDQYESEAKFVVRATQRSDPTGGFSFLVQLGLQRSSDNSFVVQEFISSRDAIRKLQERLPLEQMFRTDAIDIIAGYPSFLYGPREEQFYKYFQTMVSVIHTDATGISTLRVRAFSAKDAKRIADTLLQISEEWVNRLNERHLRDAIGRAEAEVKIAANRVVAAQEALTEFRNRELLIDPMNNATALADLISKLSAELSEAQAKATEARMYTGSGPQLLMQERLAIALGEQIASERGRVARGADNLAERVATYERLVLEREFANKMLSTSDSELVRAREDAMKRLLYLGQVTEPHSADYSSQPKRLRSILTTFTANLLLFLIAWLVFTGIREHVARHE